MDYYYKGGLIKRIWKTQSYFIFGIITLQPKSRWLGINGKVLAFTGTQYPWHSNTWITGRIRELKPLALDGAPHPVACNTISSATRVTGSPGWCENKHLTAIVWKNVKEDMMQFLCSTADWGLTVLALLVVTRLLTGNYVWRMLCSLIFCLIILCVKSWENFAYSAFCIYIQIKQTTSNRAEVDLFFLQQKAINSLKTYQQGINSSDLNLNLPFFRNNQSLAFQSKAENVNQFIVTSTCCD